MIFRKTFFLLNKNKKIKKITFFYLMYICLYYLKSIRGYCLFFFNLNSLISLNFKRVMHLLYILMLTKLIRFNNYNKIESKNKY